MVNSMETLNILLAIEFFEDWLVQISAECEINRF